jgi:hypothetical protein
VPGLTGAHTFAPTFQVLDERMREVIALVEDLPPGTEAVRLRWERQRRPRSGDDDPRGA